MTHVLVLLLCVTGFATLALATGRQQEELLGRALPPETTRALSIAGWIVLGVSLGIALGNWGWGFGLVAYSGHTSLAAGTVYAAALVGARKRKNTAPHRDCSPPRSAP